MNDNTLILNRLRKNQKRLKSYIKDNNLEAFRLYDKDIPEYPYIIDVYGSKLVIFEKGKKLQDDERSLKFNHLADIKTALNELYPEYEVVVKERVQNKGKQQYEKQENIRHFFTVTEGPLKFRVNTYDYIDCGLFLDHRPLRKKIMKEAQNKSVLNLYCYTGAISVAAAFAGAKVTSVDMSKTYLKWAEKNFELNKFDPKDHKFLREDISAWLPDFHETFDLIVLDPPSFSNSKKMEDIFDIQRDHVEILKSLAKNLNDAGKLYFSNNLRNFKLDSEVESLYKVREITKDSIPPDFRDAKIHHCFELIKLSL